MTNRNRKIRTLAEQLTKLADKADELDLELGNGTKVGSLLFVCACELLNIVDTAIEKEKYQLEAK